MKAVAFLNCIRLVIFRDRLLFGSRISEHFLPTTVIRDASEVRAALRDAVELIRDASEVSAALRDADD